MTVADVVAAVFVKSRADSAVVVAVVVVVAEEFVVGGTLGNHQKSVYQSTNPLSFERSDPSARTPPHLAMVVAAAVVVVVVDNSPSPSTTLASRRLFLSLYPRLRFLRRRKDLRTTQMSYLIVCPCI